MNLLAFSDLHCAEAEAAALVEAAEHADLVIGAGDFASQHTGLTRAMASIRAFEHKAVFVPGNNETPEALRAETSAPVLHGAVTEVAGLVIAGIGGAVPPLPPLPWNSYDLEEDQAAAMLAQIDRADILITHSPPHGVADTIDDGLHIGSHAIAAAIGRIKPRLVLCGHIHGCWGQSGTIGDAAIHNLGPRPNWFHL